MRKVEVWVKNRRFFELLGNSINAVNLNSHSTWAHEFAKVKLAWSCLSKGHFFLTEAKLKYGRGRVDFVCLSEGVIREVVATESLESIEEKRKKYPKELELEIVKA